MKQAQSLELLADRTEHLDKAILARMPETVRAAAANARLGPLTVLTFILRWPGWQITTLYTKGFKVAGIVEPCNIYAAAKSKAEISLTALLDVATQTRGTPTSATTTKLFTTILTCTTLHRISLKGT